MLHRLLVRTKSDIEDVQGQSVAGEIRKELGISVDSVSLVKVYTLDGLSREKVRVIVELSLLHDPVLQEISISPVAKDFDWIVEVGFRPGVTDNEARVAQETICTGLELSDKEKLSVYTSIQYVLKGRLSKKEVEHIARDLLSNQLIEQCRIKGIEDWEKNPGFEPITAQVTGISTDHVDIVPISSMDENELKALSQERILALSLEELICIQRYYGRSDVRQARERINLPPESTDVELEVLAQTWSEHCKHKIFNAQIRYENKETGQVNIIDSLFKTYIQNSTETIRSRLQDDDFCLSVFKDNAGVIRFDDQTNICIKVETHNSPSALDPYGGALTGIVGVNRDPLGTGLGAELICNTDVFCFASPFYQDQLPPRLLHPRRVLEGVRKGVEHGGNQSGIPTVNGGLVFDERYLGKPLVFCGTVGRLPAKINGQSSQNKKAGIGDRVVMVGGRVGKDGIHGATFSSEALHAGSPATAVQIGDPITQRKMYDFLITARDMGWYTSITDNGAGGLSSSVGEMAEDTGGCELDVARVPLKYDGLNPWEILLSEAQERMTVSVPENCLDSFLDKAREMDVEATVLGEFNQSGYFRVWYRDKPVAELDMNFLHHGLPQMSLQAVWEKPDRQVCSIPDWVKSNPRRFLRRMLGRLNICCREYVIRQYDHEVQGGSVIKPLVGPEQEGPGDAAVIRPILDKKKGLVVSNGLCPRYSDLDTYWMMACAIDEGIRNAVAVGGNLRHMAGVDNFCWCDPVLSENTPDGDYKLAQLVRANQALAHYCQGFGVPCISGKDSMKNDYFMEGYKISIPATVLFSVVSPIPAVERCLSSEFKKPGDIIYILGLTRSELGRSEFASEIEDLGGDVPQVDLIPARERYLKFYDLVQEGLINACHDISDGGLAVAVAEMAIGSSLGAELRVEDIPISPQDMLVEEILYSETPSRLLITIPQAGQRAFERRLGKQTYQVIGQVRENTKLTFYYQGERYLHDEIDELRKAWKETLNW